MILRFLLIFSSGLALLAADSVPSRLTIAPNRRFLQTSDGKPFFWLGDTAWLLFKTLDRAEVERYLEDRRSKGFNVIQAVLLHTAGDRNAYGAPALVESDLTRSALTPGCDPSRPGEYDFWDHVDWIVETAAAKGIYIAMLPSWGSLARNGTLNAKNVQAYVRFLAGRYGAKSNIIWVTGGDTRGDQDTEVWRLMGRTLKELAPEQLVTFHPFGRTQSSTWFHAEPWLDFNMFQSGHRRYDQDADTPDAKGEDNWRYVREDYEKTPRKPTIDGEPSYEQIPQGLHDTSQPYWTDGDIRRYAWWSVLAGAFGHTYGHNSVMQMYKPGSKEASYGPRKYWFDALDDPGAGQMQWLKNLTLSRPFLERVPDQGLVAGENGVRYEYVVASRGRGYAFLYTYTGQPFRVRMGRISGRTARAWWYNPRTGAAQHVGAFPNRGVQSFAPPGLPAAGNDWVLVLDDAAADFGAPGKPQVTQR